MKRFYGSSDRNMYQKIDTTKIWYIKNTIKFIVIEIWWTNREEEKILYISILFHFHYNWITIYWNNWWEHSLNVKGDDDPILFTFITIMLRIFLLQLKYRNVLLIQREESQKRGILILKQNIFMSHLQISEKIILREKM